MKIDSGCGDDIINVAQTNGDVALNSGAGIHSSINLTIEDTLGGIDIDFGSAKQHTIILSNTRGDISVDTGFRVENSYISIQETFGDVYLKVGSGKSHNVSLSDTVGDVSLKYDLGDKSISASKTAGSFTAVLGNGDDEMYVKNANGEVKINSGDGSHQYKLHDISNGNVDIKVGKSVAGFLLGSNIHQFDLKNIDGPARITTGDGDCVLNSHNDVNTAADVHLTSGNGNRNIAGTAMRSFRALMGDGNDHISLSNTAELIDIRSGDGLHNLNFEATAGSIDVDVGRAVGRGALQSFTITETIGSIKLKAGKGNYRVVIQDTSDGDISVTTGQNSGMGIFDIKDTLNGAVSIMSAGGPSNDISIVNTNGGSAFDGDVAVVIGQGPCTLDIDYTSGDIYIELQGPDADVVDLLDIGGSINVKTWDGNDLVSVDELYGSLFIDLGAGNDIVSIKYLGGNGTVLGGIGDDTLKLDARGSSTSPTNTMDGSHLNWNGGEGSDIVEIYFVPVGTMNLILYNMKSDGVFGRCSNEDDMFNPSFSSGILSQSTLASMDGYMLVDVRDCCAAHLSWDAMCSANSAQRRIQQGTMTQKSLFAPNYSSMKCESKLVSEGNRQEENEFYNTLSDCCKEKFPNSVTSCCGSFSEGGCTLSGVVQWLPDWANGHCYEKDSNLVEEWELRWSHETLESCCGRCKFH